MKKEEYKIHIIGAGVSGLIAAKILEAKGYRPIIFDAADRVGGRVKTDEIEAYQLDHGFQVLLDAYPEAQKHLDYSDLELQRFRPGAVIFKDGKSHTIGDPLRDRKFLLKTIFSSIGALKDKLKILSLNSELKKKSISDIFNTNEVSTLDYLKGKGFSDSFITDFFKPFFAGIFLEPDLKTSSRMFEFVYKMFGTGYAVLPKSGIEAIPQQLKRQLKYTEFQFNTKVKEVQDDKLLLDDGTTVNTHFTIIATESDTLIPNLKSSSHWKSCDNLYFEVKDRKIETPIIGLISNTDALINNIFFHSSLEMNQSGKHNLLSVTVVKDHKLGEHELIEQVSKELRSICGITPVRCIKCFQITRALPDLIDLQYDCAPSETKIKPTIFLAGDQLLNGSLNAAMLSGERAAQGLIEALEDGLQVEHLTSEYI